MTLVREGDQPYRDAHRASVARKAAPPKHLLRWFLEAYRAEAVDEIHGAGVWRDRVTDGTDQRGGGSLLGAPRYTDMFRRIIEERPTITETAEYDGHRDLWPHYVFPLRAALARLAGRGPADGDAPFMARVLVAVAQRDGDFDAACASFGIPPQVRRVYIESALYRLWARYQVEPGTVREVAAA